MIKMNETKKVQIKKHDLETLEKVSGGQFLTPEDQAWVYEVLTNERYLNDDMYWDLEDPVDKAVYESAMENYEYELTNTERKITGHEWFAEQYGKAMNSLYP